MHSVCTTYYANRSTTVVDRLLSTISIAEFLMCLPFHTLQLTRFRVSRDSMLPVYHCWIAVLTHLGGSGYAKSVRRCQNCLLDTKRWCQSCKVQRSKIFLVKRIDLSIYLTTTQRKSELRCRLQRQVRLLRIHQFYLESYPLAYPQTFSDAVSDSFHKSNL